MPIVNIQSHQNPNAKWRFSKRADCQHERTSKFLVGTYIDYANSGRIYGLKCKDCNGLKY